MKIVNIPFEDIHYETKPFDDDLKNSLSRISFSFPIKVEKAKQGYHCIDGNKRLSAVYWMKKHHFSDREFNEIPAIIMSDARTDNGWSLKRYH